jgi:hypothetical protein
MKTTTAVIFTLFSVTVMAGDVGRALGTETYRFLERSESLLGRAAAQMDRDAYAREVQRPASAMAQKWPPMGDESIDRYRRCQMAVNAFMNYADDQFKAGGKLPKTTLAAKDYFEQKRQCKASLGR